ncbi:MAG TPA: endolytic transglycosylase MltG [Bacteroidales bacterium]|nr:endolytic transglycosylase MltG [Bacteroidales bacterium]
MKKGRIILAAAASLLLIALFFMWKGYSGLRLNTGDESKVLLIPTGSTYQDVIDSINTVTRIENQKVFDWIADRKGYPQHVKAGRYMIDPGVNYSGLIDMLRAGRQKPVNVTFNNIRTLAQLAGRLGGRIEGDSSSLMAFFNDERNYASDGFNRATIISVFLPNTYQIFWNTDAKGFYSRMLKEYHNFWNQDRIARAKAKGLTPLDVSILASIVDDEVAKGDEKPRIAGVYLNRLKRGMLLQSCPTIKFALNDFTITRVLRKHLVVESPYNTYKYKGLPPGPVGCPSIQGIEAVLNAENNDYLYFAAKADFSGYHNFSRTLSEHNRYAAQYQAELNRRKIFD